MSNTTPIFKWNAASSLTCKGAVILYAEYKTEVWVKDFFKRTVRYAIADQYYILADWGQPITSTSTSTLTGKVKTDYCKRSSFRAKGYMTARITYKFKFMTPIRVEETASGTLNSPTVRDSCHNL